jgi:DNA-binding FadR family transcriptional regulator
MPDRKTQEAPDKGATKAKSHSAVHRAAAKMRAWAMGRPEGTLLGSEEELMNQLEVSRPTLRQAAALVAQERLITIRRGVNGGYFAALPDSLTVARMAAIYLQSRHARLIEVIEAVEPIRTELARLASRNRDADAREQLAEFLDQERAIPQTDYRSFLRAERAFGRVLATVSGNRVLELFLNIVYDLSAFLGRDEDVYANHPDRIETYRSHRNRMAAAILDGDEEMAVLATRRCSAIVMQWIHEDLKDGLSTAQFGVRARAAE